MRKTIEIRKRRPRIQNGGESTGSMNKEGTADVKKASDVLSAYYILLTISFFKSQYPRDHGGNISILCSPNPIIFNRFSRRREKRCLGSSDLSQAGRAISIPL